MKNFLHGCIFLLFTTSSFSQASNTWAIKFSNAIMTRYTPTINALTSKGWEYSNTIILHGMEKVYNANPTPSYLAYIKAYADAYVNTDGTFKAGVTLVSLDRIHPGIILLFLYQKTGLSQYHIAATTLRNVLVGAGASYNSFRTPVNKIFWHKQTGYDNIMMLDGMYMAHPFLAKYGSMFGDNAAIDTAVNQTLFAYNQLYVSSNKLIKHAWKEPGTPGTPPSWTPDGAGNSPSVWSRAMGWYVMALVDILKYVPAAHPKRAQLIAALTNLAAGIKTAQDPATHLWYQVVNKTSATLPGNYLESSGSAMFVYALKTACDSNWISPATYLQTAIDGWNGLRTYAIDVWPTDGGPRINNFAPAMSALNSDALYAGTASVDCPGSTHPHGYAAILMAASVMEFPLSTLPVKFISFTAKEFTDNIRLSWKYGDESGIDRYEILKSTDGRNFNAVGTMQSNSSSNYSWVDNTIADAARYYRIKAVSFDGSFYYSAILPVKQNKADLNVQVSPNPVSDGAVNIFLNNMKPGKYSLKLINNAGSAIEIKTLDISDGSNVVQTVSLPVNSSKGLYYVQLEGNGLKINKTILIQ